MLENENRRSVYLRILIYYTVMEFALLGEGLFLGWDMSAVLLLFLGLGASWIIYITEKLPENFCLWIYFIMAMLAFFYYGLHETSIYDLAPVMVVFIFLMASTGKHLIVRLCTVTYFFTMIYALLFVAGDSIVYDPLTITRIILHFAMVCVADWLAKVQQQKRKDMDKIMADKIAAMEENNHKMGNFLVNVSHELRTPINAIMGFTSVILNKEKDPLKRREIQLIQGAGHRLFDQIEDILDYTEIDTGSMKINQDDYMISSIVNDIVVAEKNRDGENLPEIIFDVDPTIPARLVGDGHKIKKVLKHLIDNAVKFTSNGAVLVEIMKRRKEYGINLCIRVTDTGVGIKEENISKLYSKFYQQNSERNRSANGLGLGLSIMHGIVSAMGGFVKIESKEKEGTVVSVTIPQKVSDEDFSISVDKPEEFCIACYLKPEKYQSAKIFRFYDNMISHMARGLHISLHRTGSEGELDRILSKYRVTHLFIAQEEYNDRPQYYENLCGEINVVVVTGHPETFSKNSRVTILEKPFYFLPVIDILNKNAASDSELFDMRKFVCPGIRALIVDDEPMNLMVAEEIVKSYQMQVKTANSGKRAIEICQEESFDLIFLDHMMPEMDGVETLKRLRRNESGKNVRETIIAFTANAVSGAREMFRKEGFDEFISKPIEIIEFNRVLKKVLPKNSILYLPEEGSVPIEETDALQTEKAKVSAPETETEVLEKAGIHTKSGLSYCAGDSEFYQKILENFAKESQCKKAEMQEFLESGDWGNYQIWVHSLKSTARMIGADELSDMAKASEDAAKELDGDYLTGHHAMLMKEYNRIVQAVSDAFSLQAVDGTKDIQVDTQMEEQRDMKASRELSREEFNKVLLDLKNCLDTFEADRAEGLIGKVRDAVYNGKSCEDILQEVIRDIENFELAAALEKTENLICAWEGGDA